VRLLIAGLIAGALVRVSAAEEGGLRVGGLFDVRGVRTDDTRSWLDGGPGTLRYGSPLAGHATLLRLSQASLLVDAPAGDFVSAHLQVNGEADGDRDGLRQRIDLIEAYVAVRAEPSARVRLRGRLGLFFPPVSLEADDAAWTGPYAITPSAATSWIADEVRTLGAEARISFRPGSHEMSLAAAAYGSNDPTGSLLAWRGWALGDRQTGVGDRLPLAPLPSIQSSGVFPRQAPWVQPFREIDGRLGYYVAASWKKAGVLDARAVHFDNRGRPTDFDGRQYAWHTTFDSAALRLQWRGLELLGQYLWGSTEMGALIQGRTAVDAPFYTAFGMASVVRGRHRLTARYDDFEVEDRDAYQTEDPNAQRGHAWTAAYSFRTGESHRLAVEVVRVESDRAARADLGLPVHATETVGQASFRVKF
jgi:hypothetical protein